MIIPVERRVWSVGMESDWALGRSTLFTVVKALSRWKMLLRVLRMVEVCYLERSRQLELVPNLLVSTTEYRRVNLCRVSLAKQPGHVGEFGLYSQEYSHRNVLDDASWGTISWHTLSKSTQLIAVGATPMGMLLQWPKTIVDISIAEMSLKTLSRIRYLAYAVLLPVNVLP